MKNFVARLLICKAMMFGALTGVAGAGTCNPISCTGVKVERIYPWTNGNLYIRPLNTDLSPLNCTAHNGQELILEGAFVNGVPQTPNYDAIFATLLSAQLNGLEVTIRTDTASSSCRVAYVFIE